MARQNNPQVMGTGITGTGAAGLVPLSGMTHGFQSILTDGGGANTATVIIQVSNDGTNWLTPALTLTHAAAGTEGGIVEAGWAWARYNVSAMDGNGDTLDIYCATGSA